MRSHLRLAQAVLGVSGLLVVGCSHDYETRPPAANGAPATAHAAALKAELSRNTVSGKVIAARTGKPLAGATLFLVYSGSSGIDERLVAKTTSDAQGAYCFPNAINWPSTQPSSDRESSGQRYYVFALHPDLGFSFAAILPGDRPSDVNVKLFENKINTIKVVDKDGNPVVGAKVFYTGGGISEGDAPELDRYHRYSNLRHDVGVLSAFTDATGTAKLAGLYDGCNYVAIKDGYARNYGQESIPLLPGRDVKGKVTYADGRPAANALVKCDFNGERLVWSDYARTDANGCYSFTNVPVIGYYYGFNASAKGNDKGTITISADPAEANSGLLSKPVSFPAKTDDKLERDIVLQRGCVVGGQIIDDRTGKPLPGIAVECYQLAQGQESYDSKSVTTDASGRFQTSVAPGSRFFARIQDSRDGSYVLDHEWMRQQPNLEYQACQIDAVNADKTNNVVRLRLWDIQTFSGTVTDPSGQAVANAVVYLNTHLPPARTDVHGQFTLKAAPKDREFELCIMSPDKSLGALQKFPAGTATASIQLKPTITREGIVTTPSGLPADNLQFYLDLKLNGESNYSLRQEPKTDAAGHFKAQSMIPSAQYGIFWTTDNETNRDYSYGDAKVNLAELKDADPIRFQAKKFVNALMGQVVDPAGKPVPNATILIGQGSELVPQNQQSGLQGITTDKDGNFTLPRLADGELTLKVTAQGLKPTQFRTSTDNIDCKITMRSLAEPTLYRATVRDTQGQPVAEAQVTLFTRQHTGSKMESSKVARTSDANGVVTFDPPTTAPTTRPVQFSQNVMLCDAPGYDLAISQNAQLGEDLDAQFTLTKSDKHWKGKVVDAKGQPIADAKILVTNIRLQGNEYASVPLDESDDGFALLRFTSTADGTFELTRIPYNWVNITVSAPGMRTNNAYFDPQADASLAAKNIVMTQGTSVKGRIVIKSTGQSPSLSGKQEFTAILFQNTQGQSVNAAQLKPDGSFTTDNLEAGKYTARFISMEDELRKYVLKTPVAFEANVGETVNLTIELEEGIPLKGKLVGAKLEAQMQGMYGAVSATKPGSGTNFIYDGAGKIQKDGTWTIYLPDAGEYTLKYLLPNANGMGQTEKTAQIIKIEPGKTPDEVVIEHKP